MFDLIFLVLWKFSFPWSNNQLFLKQALTASEKTTVDNLFQKDSLVRQSQVWWKVFRLNVHNWMLYSLFGVVSNTFFNTHLSVYLLYALKCCSLVAKDQKGFSGYFAEDERLRAVPICSICYCCWWLISC